VIFGGETILKCPYTGLAFCDKCR